MKRELDPEEQENYLHASTVDSRILECAVSFVLIQ